jgi:hypothetical protein
MQVNFYLNFQKLFLCGIQCPCSIGKDWDMEGTIGRRCVTGPTVAAETTSPQVIQAFQDRSQGQGQGILRKVRTLGKVCVEEGCLRKERS